MSWQKKVIFFDGNNRLLLINSSIPLRGRKVRTVRKVGRGRAAFPLYTVQLSVSGMMAGSSGRGWVSGVTWMPGRRVIIIALWMKVANSSIGTAVFKSSSRAMCALYRARVDNIRYWSGLWSDLRVGFFIYNRFLARNEPVTTLRTVFS